MPRRTVGNQYHWRKSATLHSGCLIGLRNAVGSIKMSLEGDSRGPSKIREADRRNYHNIFFHDWNRWPIIESLFTASEMMTSEGFTCVRHKGEKNNVTFSHLLFPGWRPSHWWIWAAGLFCQPVRVASESWTVCMFSLAPRGWWWGFTEPHGDPQTYTSRRSENLQSSSQLFQRENS